MANTRYTHYTPFKPVLSPTLGQTFPLIPISQRNPQHCPDLHLHPASPEAVQFLMDLLANCDEAIIKQAIASATIGD